MMEFATPSAAAATNAEEMVLIVSITGGGSFLHNYIFNLFPLGVISDFIKKIIALPC